MRTAIAAKRFPQVNSRANPRVNNLVHLNSKSRTGYRFLDKDTDIDEVLFLCRQDGRTLHAIAQVCGMSPKTLQAWDLGKTRRPQNASISIVLKVLGYERRIVRSE